MPLVLSKTQKQMPRYCLKSVTLRNTGDYSQENENVKNKLEIVQPWTKLMPLNRKFSPCY